MWADSLCCFRGMRCLVARGCVYEAGTCSCCRPAHPKVLLCGPCFCRPSRRPQACGWPCPVAPDAKAGGATNVRAASRVALADTEVSTGRVGLTAGWGSPAVGGFLHKSSAHGAPCFPVPIVAATQHYPMDVAVPSPDARTICRLVCALLPAMTFPAFLQFACVLLG